MAHLPGVEVKSVRYRKSVNVERDIMASGTPVIGLWKTLRVDSLDQLHEVQRNGAVAQAERASELLIQITANPNDPELEVEVSVLYDAYLNDPYLTRNKES
jgi:hypothetical protein